jgi:hypothetical protein
VARGAALDKAGAYAIQDTHFHPVARLQGCYCNVVGLPLGLVLRLLREAGYPVGQLLRPPQCADCPDWVEGDSWPREKRFAGVTWERLLIKRKA